MGILDIIGPVMVGPSSSHTAGAARIGLYARRLLGAAPARAELLLHGSFAATGEGHGTNLALLAGLLGMEADDERIPKALEEAAAAGLQVAFGTTDLGEVHPNSVRLLLEGEGRGLDLCASSVGGGRIRVWRVDGAEVNLDGSYPTLLLLYPDQPGELAVFSAILANAGLNIATVKVDRTGRGMQALMQVELDQVPPAGVLQALRHLPQVDEVRFIPALGNGA